MTIAYIAHPIRGNVRNNINKVLEIVKNINLTEPEVVPFAPYISDCLALNDLDPEERKRGFINNKALFESGIINEVRLYGKHISIGMKEEILWANQLGIKVTNYIIPLSDEGKFYEILEAACKAAEIDIEDLQYSIEHKIRDRKYVTIKQISIGLYIDEINKNRVSEFKRKDSIKISKWFNIDHSTVLYSYDVYCDMIQTKNKEFNKLLEETKTYL